MRGGEEEDDREEDAAIKGPDSPIPLSLYEEC